ncbi:MAG TPA: FAD-binding oxidoreductase [Terriglobales bacterium]|nr:FAD-binding oxidoreductase [Terriglobales bacterium]
MLTAIAVQDLQQELRGELLAPDNPEYDAARKVWNGMVDKRPALIARCADATDVVACIRFARERDVPISVRGGGHNYAGKAICDDGLVVDLSRMKGIWVDQDRRTVRAQAGLRLGEFDRETQKYGLATTLGVNTDTGVSGLTLGGGYGWLAGKYGLACDNVIRAEVVTAEGVILPCSEEQNADLFWGLRGAGANFGVVTEFEYKLHPVSKVLGGLILYPLHEEVLRFFDEFSSSAPDELTMQGVVLTGPDGSPAFGIGVCHCGSPEAGEEAIKPLRNVAKPLADLIQPRPYLDMQAQFDQAWPPGRHYYNKAHNVRRLSDGAIQTILRYSATLPTPVSNIALQQMHGAASRIPVSATAFPHRYDHHDLLVHPATDNPTDKDRIIGWARECWEALKPFVERAVYVNALEDGLEEGELRVREAYGANYERLVALKKKYDPTNLFRENSNIRPA